MPALSDTGRRLEFHGTREGYIAERIEAKTASYTLLAEDGGKTFTNRGDTDAITFTLPGTTEVETGWWAKFFVVAGFSMAVISAGSNDNLVVFNDATADSIKFSTSSEIIGNGLKCVFDGTGWLTEVSLGAETVTPTIA